MAWALSAHGETSPDAEEDMKQALMELLSDPRYGALGSQFSGASHNGPVHHGGHKKPSKPVKDG